MKNPGRWETDCGRYENQNYPVGNAIDPQLWKMITDDELGSLARGEKNLSGFRGKAVDYFAWALTNRRKISIVIPSTSQDTSSCLLWCLEKEAEWVETKLSDLREKRNFGMHGSKHFPIRLI